MTGRHQNTDEQGNFEWEHAWCDLDDSSIAAAVDTCKAKMPSGTCKSTTILTP
jgi:hypothetical protein